MTTNTFTDPPVEMAKERAKTTFTVRDVTNFLNGGEEETQIVEKIMSSIERDPVLSITSDYDCDMKQARKQTMERVAALSPYLVTDTEKLSLWRAQLHGMVDMSTRTRLSIHNNLFIGSIRGSGTPEQFKFWVKKGAVAVKQFYGCFAMTELGHGSNLKGLETTATYDQNTDEFIVNTPHIGATKWWIGGAAHTSTHCVCFAKLIVHGKDYGTRNFVVPLRNINDHSLKVGVSIGDIGKKMGRDGVDNGWIQFTNVRIPRQNMLMRYAKVSSTGIVTKPALDQLTYGALIRGRVSMIADSFHVSKRFLTIALRYACVRRQFGTSGDSKETKIIDYPYHQRRLLPLLAYCYAMKMGADEAQKAWIETTDRILALNPNDPAQKKDLEKAVTDTKELFAASAGMKAFTTWACAKIIDECRQACGGHGYSGYNGFGQGYADWVVQCTWEGDNNVLCLSMGRGLVQSALQILSGKHVGASIQYVGDKSKVSQSGQGTPKEKLLSPEFLVEAFRTVSRNNILRTTEKYQELTKTLNPDQAFEELSQQRFQCARIHTRQHLIASFYARIATAKEDIKPQLMHLANLFALWSIEEDTGIFLREGVLTPGDIDVINGLVDELCVSVRDQVIGLTDAFGLTDFFINAPIGSYDGNVYEKYFAKVNQQNPATNPRPEYYDSVLKPFLFREEEDDDICELDDD